MWLNSLRVTDSTSNKGTNSQLMNKSGFVGFSHINEHHKQAVHRNPHNGLFLRTVMPITYYVISLLMLHSRMC